RRPNTALESSATPAIQGRCVWRVCRFLITSSSRDVTLRACEAAVGLFRLAGTQNKRGTMPVWLSDPVQTSTFQMDALAPRRIEWVELPVDKRNQLRKDTQLDVDAGRNCPFVTVDTWKWIVRRRLRLGSIDVLVDEGNRERRNRDDNCPAYRT